MSAKLMKAESTPNISNWNADDGYDIKCVGEKYPRSATTSMFFGALQLGLVQLKSNSELKCFNEMALYRMYLHQPGDIPLLTRLGIQIHPSETTMISIKPKLITTSPKLRNYTPERRQCFFNFERQLRFHQIYTQKNCQLECLADYLKDECKCVPYYMTSMTGTFSFEMKNYLN